MNPRSAGKNGLRWADPGSWGMWQIALLLGVVVVLAVLAFRALGG
jgi:hypothetical protein